MKKLKNDYTPDLLCQSEETRRLHPFLTNIFSLGFEETPNYDKLRFMLLKIMLELNQTPNNVYDWNVEYVRRMR